MSLPAAQVLDRAVLAKSPNMRCKDIGRLLSARTSRGWSAGSRVAVRTGGSRTTRPGDVGASTRRCAVVDTPDGAVTGVLNGPDRSSDTASVARWTTGRAATGGAGLALRPSGTACRCTLAAAAVSVG